MKPMYYDREGIPIADTLTWARKIENRDYQRIDLTELADGTTVSTVWLGLDHQYGNGPPLIFETMVFTTTTDGREGADQERYATEEEARAGHAAMVAKHSPAPRPPRES